LLPDKKFATLLESRPEVFTQLVGIHLAQVGFAIVVDSHRAILLPPAISHQHSLPDKTHQKKLLSAKPGGFI
jgi:hypothetical protein